MFECVYVYVWMGACMHAHTHARTYVCMLAYMYVSCMYVSLCHLYSLVYNMLSFSFCNFVSCIIMFIGSPVSFSYHLCSYRVIDVSVFLCMSIVKKIHTYRTI